ncbi:MAG TPA: HNH endonuclease signature motif containing protein [Flavobacteriales bacterium]|nr:HNH endonuclease signature motif containing protein [Flavobacteriales bacterium]
MSTPARRRDAWTPQEDAILREKYPVLKTEALMELLPSRTRHSIVCRACKLKITVSNPKHAWTPEEDEYLRVHFATHANSTLAKKMKLDPEQVANHGHFLGLKKTRATWLRIQRKNGVRASVTNVETRFQKGLLVWNKGKKMRIDVFDRCKATMFKKGQVSNNKKPIGTEVLDPDGYRKRKVSEGLMPNQRNWKLVHVILWEQHHGPVPPGHVVTFLDLDKTNIVIENLECITKAERAIRTKQRTHGNMDYVALAQKAWKTRRLRQALLEKGVPTNEVMRAFAHERRKTRPSRAIA